MNDAPINGNEGSMKNFALLAAIPVFLALLAGVWIFDIHNEGDSGLALLGFSLVILLPGACLYWGILSAVFVLKKQRALANCAAISMGMAAMTSVALFVPMGLELAFKKFSAPSPYFHPPTIVERIERGVYPLMIGSVLFLGYALVLGLFLGIVRFARYRQSRQS